MNSTKFWRLAVLPVTALALLTFGSQSGRPQGPPPPGIDAPGIPLQLNTPKKIAETPVPAPTVDNLIEQLKQVRKQKAELEAREKAVISQLQGLLKNQNEELRKLGIEVAPEPGQATFIDDKKDTDLVPLPKQK